MNACKKCKIDGSWGARILSLLLLGEKKDSSHRRERQRGVFLLKATKQCPGIIPTRPGKFYLPGGVWVLSTTFS